MLVLRSKQQFDEKPEPKGKNKNGYLSALQTQPCQWVEQELNVNAFADLVGGGCSFRAGLYPEWNNDDYTAVMTGIFVKKNALGANILALDFDDCPQTPEQVIEFSRKYWVEPNFYYYSFNQGKKKGNRFRLVYCFDEILSVEEYESYYKEIIKVYDKNGYKMDKACKDISRIWHGTNKGSVVLNENPYDRRILRNFHICVETEKGKPISNIKRQKNSKYFENESLEKYQVEKDWIDKIRGRFVLVDKWLNGEYLDYSDRLCLFSNVAPLCRYDNGNTLSSLCYDDFWEYFNPKLYEGHALTREWYDTYLHSSLTFSAPLLTKDGDYETIVEFLKYKHNVSVEPQIEKLQNDFMNPHLEHCFSRFIKDSGISYFQSQTATGKTELTINTFLSDEFIGKKIIYATPTYSTLYEFKERLERRAEQQGKMIEVHLIEKTDYTEYDKKLLKMGLPAETKNHSRRREIEALQNPKKRGIFLMSHQLLVNLKDIDVDMVFVDENIEDTLIKEYSFPVESLRKVGKYISPKTKKKLEAWLDEQLTQTTQEKKEIVEKDLFNEILNELLPNVAQYLRTEVMVCEGLYNIPPASSVRILINDEGQRIRIICKSKLLKSLEEKKIPLKMMTATPNLERAKALLDVEIKVYKCSKYMNEGRIIEIMKKSGARGLKNEKVNELIDFVEESLNEDIIKIAKVISFKGTEEMWEKRGFTIARDNQGNQIHLANSAGLDCLKGQTVIVAGKFDKTYAYYKNLYWDIYPDRNDAPSRSSQWVDVCGVKTKLYTFNDETMRNIHIETMTMYLEQAVGRARALREKDARVYVFADLPLADADEIILK